MKKLNRDAVMQVLPHRPPMLLIDEAEQPEDGVSVGRYTVRGDEYFLQGHFPGNPVVPGVIQCEMMAQSACLLVPADVVGTPYFTGMEKVKFKRKVLPGDILEFTCRLTKHKGVFYFAECVGRVGDKVCCSAEISFAIVRD